MNFFDNYNKAYNLLKHDRIPCPERLGIARIKRASKFRIKIMRKFNILDVWINAISDPDCDIVDPIERQMVHDLINESAGKEHESLQNL